MSIQDITRYGGLYGFNPMRSVPVVYVQDTQKQQPEVKDAPAEQQQSQQQSKAPKSADLQNISLKFNTGDDFGYIGKDSDLHTRSIEKAISDMQKDTVLRQYQTFVGNDETVFASEDGVVLRK